MNLADRFLSKISVRGSGCWSWIGAKDRKGYGVLSVGPKLGIDGKRRNTMVRANRISWELYQGKIPDGKWVLHRCDNPECTNPEHLFIGDALSNVRDMDTKGRRKTVTKKGHEHYESRFTPEEIKEIRSQYAAKLATQKELAARYSVNKLTIYKIVRRISYK